MTGLRSAKVWAPLVVAAICLLGVGLAEVAPGVSSEPSHRPAVPEISEEGRALLGELKVGDKLVGWEVQALDGPRDGILRIDVGRDDVRFALMVAKKDARPESPPLSTEEHAIFYGHAQPPETELPANTIRATTHELARRIRANEGRVDVPGM